MIAACKKPEETNGPGESWHFRSCAWQRKEGRTTGKTFEPRRSAGVLPPLAELLACLSICASPGSAACQCLMPRRRRRAWQADELKRSASTWPRSGRRRRSERSWSRQRQVIIGMGRARRTRRGAAYLSLSRWRPLGFESALLLLLLSPLSSENTEPMAAADGVHAERERGQRFTQTIKQTTTTSSFE